MVAAYLQVMVQVDLVVMLVREDTVQYPVWVMYIIQPMVL